MMPRRWCDLCFGSWRSGHEPGCPYEDDDEPRDDDGYNPEFGLDEWNPPEED